MRIACASIYDAQDPAAFGGRVYESLQSIRRRVDRLYFLGPLNTGAYKPILRVKGKYYRHVQRKTYFPERDRLSVRSYARQLSKRLSKVEADIVFSPESPYSQPIAYLECAQPIVIWTDATFAGASRLYDEYRPENLCRESFRDAIENERAALTRAAALIYSSDWAAQTAIHEYAVSPDKISVIPFGPASDIGIANVEEARAIIDARPRDRCRLLFVGLDWVRKGGSTVLEVARRLNAGGLKTELSIIGSYPDLRETLPKFAQTLGYISRASIDGANKLNELFMRSHFLFLPTRADCTPLVFSEASAFAVPSLATNVGGISTVVRSGVTGQTFPLDADPDEYCGYISNLFANYGSYRELALSSFAEFKQRLNNEVAADGVLKVMAELF